MTGFLDADGTILFQRELEHIKSKTFDVEYPKFTYDKVFDVNSDTPAGANSITYEVYDKKGRAKVIAGAAGANDIPRVDIDGKEVTIPVREIADSFAYTLREIKNAQFAGKPLSQRKANAAREIIEQEHNYITWYGDAAAGLNGFFSLVTAGTIPSANAPNGAGGTATWATKTAAEILADVNAAFGAVFTTSKGAERANMMGIPLAQWNLIVSTNMGTGTDTTIAKYIIMNSPYISSMDQIMPINELGDIDGSGTDGLMVWTKNPDKVQVEIPEDVNFLPVQQQGLEYVTIALSLFAGLNYYKPLSAYVLKGI